MQTHNRDPRTRNCVDCNDTWPCDQSLNDHGIDIKAFREAENRFLTRQRVMPSGLTPVYDINSTEPGSPVAFIITPRKPSPKPRDAFIGRATIVPAPQ